MFAPGDLIVYGRTGVCRVEAIEQREGEALLFGELAVALDIAPEAVPAYIQARLERSRR